VTTAVPTGNTYDKYRSKNPIERRLVDGFFAALSDTLPRRPPETVLEVGIGEGEVSSTLRSLYPRSQIVGVDLLDDVLAAEWRARDLVGVYADITHLPFPLEDLRPRDGHRGARARAVPGGRPRGARAPQQRPSRAVGAREPIWRAANLAPGKYLSDLGNTPGHIQHWSRRRFTELVGAQLDVVTVSTPFPWTMVGARSRH
jgi:phytoene dehydrogenase-like protein